MGGKISKSIIRFHNIIYYERKKQELVNIAYSKDALTNYIQRHRDDIDELLSWDSHSETALHFVVNEGWMEGVEAIVEAGADVNVFDANKFEILPNVPGREAYVLYTPLMCVVGNHRNLEIAQYLLAHGADPHLRCPNTGWSAISLAIANCRVDLILLLIEEYDVEPTKVFDMMCEWLFRKYNRSSKLDTIVLIELLLEKGAQMRPHYVHFALNRGWLEVLKVFVKAGADINSLDTGHEFTLDVYTCGIYLQPHSRGFPWNMYTPLMRAARSPDLFDIAQYLLAHGADPHLKCPNTGESAVSVAIKHSNADLVQLLIQKYNVECDPTKALTMTIKMLSHSTNEECQQDTAEFIELLLEKGAQRELHYMHVAVGRGWLKLVEVFVKAGSDVNLFDTDSCYRPYRECVKCFNPAHHESVSQSCSCSHQPFDRRLQTRIRYTPLMIAATSQDLFDIAQYLLAHGADPHLRCPNTGESAVSVAIKHDNADLVQLLIQKYNVKFDPTKALTMTWNMLSHSTNEECQQDTAEFIELLLEKGAQMELHYMHVAVGRGWLKLVEVFVKAGSDVNVFDTDSCYRSYRECVKCFNPAHHESVSQSCSHSDKPFDSGLETRIRHTPLMIAARSTHLFDIAQYLLAHGADPHLKCPNTGESAVSVAIKHSNADLVQLLIQKHNVKCDPTKALTLTWNLLRRKGRIEQDIEEFIELLLGQGAQMGLHYMHVAVTRGWLKLVEIFVKAGSDVNVFDRDSCYRPSRECIKCFNPAHTKIAYRRCSHSDRAIDRRLQTRIQHTPLMIAARSKDHFDIAQYLLAHGADPHLKCPNTGTSAISLAIAYCDVDFMQLLIEKYDVNPTKVLDMTCEWLFTTKNESYEHKTLVLIELFLKKGAQINAHYVHLAVSKGWLEVLKVIVKAGVDINSFDKGYFYAPGIGFRTHSRPFHWDTFSLLMRAAGSTSLFDIAEYLLAHGADPHLRCPNTGKSAVSVAIRHSNADLVQLLIQKYNVKCNPTKALTITWNMLCHSNKTECQPDTADFIELLLGKGAQMGLHYMHVAVSRGWLKLVEVFVKAGYDVNLFETDSCYKPYKGCIQCFNPEHPTYKQSCSVYKNPFGRGLQRCRRNTPLMIAARSTHLFDVAQYLLAHGADPNLRCPKSGRSVFSVATQYCNVQLLQLLVEKYKVAHTEVLTLICEWIFQYPDNGCSFGKRLLNVIQLLLEKGAKLKPHYIHVAISHGWMEGVEVFVKGGADVNVFDSFYKSTYIDKLLREEHGAVTPLMRAAASPNLFNIAQYLLAHGADPHLKCPNTGESAVSVATTCCNIDLVQLLIQECNVKFDPTNVLTMQCEWLESHLNEMYEYKTRQFIKLLLKKGAQMGSHYRTVIKHLVPTPNISQDDLHSYFREGFNINNLCKYYIESENKYCPNHIRWFLRHGLDTNAPFIPHCIDKALKTHNYEIVTLLLHAGVNRFAITRWIKLPRFPCLPKQFRECNELAYNEFQEDDLVEFSDESLHIYPEVKEFSVDEIDRQYKSMVRLLSHPLTLQGLCRQCLRQSLCQPSPTVVMTLPIPKSLKRYILCHDL